MKKIWKFGLSKDGVVTMPEGADVLSIAPDSSGKLALYAIVDPEAVKVQRRIVVLGTGDDAMAVAEAGAAHVGSWGGFHVFDFGAVVQAAPAVSLEN